MNNRKLQIKNRKCPGFTLIELLVVIGIIALLAGMLVPAVSLAYRKAVIARQQADFQSIATALDQYKTDFGEYPSVDAANAGAAVLGKSLFGMADAAHYYTGGSPDNVTATPAATFNSALQNQLPVPPAYPAYAAGNTYHAGDVVIEGSAPDFTAYSTGAVTSFYVSTRDNNTGNDPSTANSIWWAKLNPFDGKDGPGFRVGYTTSISGGMAPGGTVHGPYLRAESFHINGMVILDHFDSPILYFPTFKKATVNNALGLIDTGAMPTATARPLVNFNNNLGVFYADGSDSRANAIARMAITLGDYNVNGQLDPTSNNEPTLPTLDFLLWSAGPDTSFGPTGLSYPFDNTPGTVNPGNRRAGETCDDITNFR